MGCDGCGVALGLVGVANGQAVDDPVAYWNFEDADTRSLIW